jgi:MYXO-CTERM domain-containing protein
MKTLVTNVSRAAWLRSALAVLVGLLVLSVALPAVAAGRVVWKEKTVKERTSNESWLLQMEIHLPRVPDIAHKSMKFEFVQQSEFERSLVDGHEGPQTRTIPLTNQQAIIESQIVGFMDSGSGQVQARTRFSFKVTRAHGYRAGVWKVTIKDGDSGQTIGTSTQMTLQGENEIVDRRSIVFQGNDRKKKDDKAKESPESGEGADEAPSETDPADEPPMGDEPTAAEDEGQVPPSVEEKPGGGCHHSPHDTPLGWPLLLLGVVGFLVVRRSRPR